MNILTSRAFYRKSFIFLIMLECFQTKNVCMYVYILKAKDLMYEIVRIIDIAVTRIFPHWPSGFTL